MARLSRLRAVRGIRRLIQNMPDSAVILQRDFLEAVNLLPKYNLSFDICIDPRQFEHTIEMVRRCPSVSFVLDHMGKPEVKENRLGSWRESMRELSSLPNVVCKVSGLLTQADHATWSEDQVLPLISHTIDRFGVDRVLSAGTGLCWNSRQATGNGSISSTAPRSTCRTLTGARSFARTPSRLIAWINRPDLISVHVRRAKRPRSALHCQMYANSRLSFPARTARGRDKRLQPMPRNKRARAVSRTPERAVSR